MKADSIRTSLRPLPTFARRWLPTARLYTAAFLLAALSIPASAAEDKKEKQSVLVDMKKNQLSSSAFVKLLNQKLDGKYQDLELVVTSCFGGEIASRAGGVNGLKGNWSVATSTDADHTDVNCGERKGAANFSVGGGTYNGWLPAWENKVNTDGNATGNKALADYATAEKKKLFGGGGGTPQYNSSGAAADAMTVHGGAESNHAILLQTAGFVGVRRGMEAALKGAGYTDGEISKLGTQLGTPDLTWDNFGNALDDARKKLDEHPNKEKLFIDVETHGDVKELTVAYAPGQFEQPGGGLVITPLHPFVGIHVDDPVVLATLGEELLMPGGGVYADDPELLRFGPAILSFSTLTEDFLTPSSVGILVNNISIGSLLMGNPAGRDYQISIPDAALSLVLGDARSTGMLTVGFSLGPSDSFRLATAEDWQLASYPNLDYGIGIAGDVTTSVPDQNSTLLALAVGCALLLVCGRRSHLHVHG